MNKQIKKIIHELESSEFFQITEIKNRYIFGKVIVKHKEKNMQIFREFDICIKVKKDNSYICFELANEIPIDYHHHDTKDNFLGFRSLCLGSNGQIGESLSDKKSIVSLLENFLIPYLFNFSCLEKYGICAWGEYSHGSQGIKEYYMEKLQLDSQDKLMRVFELLLSDTLFLECPCNSKKTFKECHFPFVSSIPKSTLKNDSKTIFGKKRMNNLKWTKKDGWR